MLKWPGGQTQQTVIFQYAQVRLHHYIGHVPPIHVSF